ncbi:MAG: diguanylate cyclase [Desulfuromonadaceae bacterium]|nr:diguanylate cyclase [Desulfuromonadaceae bacterium]
MSVMPNTVLIIGDSAESRKVVAGILESTGIFQNKLYCADGRRALHWLRDHAIDMVCCNLHEQNRDALDILINEMQGESEWVDLPVVFFAQPEDRDLLIEGLESGASEGLLVDVETAEIAARIRRHLKNRQRIQALHQAQSRLARMALSDSLTGLFNRAYFDASIEQESARSLRSKNPLSLLFIDLDFFKKINDTHGHQTGDLVLEKVAQVLREQSRSSDTVCRYGGEEFAIILPETPRSHAQMVAERIRRKVSVLDLGFAVTASIGINCAERPEGLVPKVLIAGADEALYAAKRNGRNRCEIAGKPAVHFPDLSFIYPFKQAAATA